MVHWSIVYGLTNAGVCYLPGRGEGYSHPLGT